MQSIISWSLTCFSMTTGQWAPIVGTGLAAVGSLYGLLAADAEGNDVPGSPKKVHCDCHHHHRHSLDNDSSGGSYQGNGTSIFRMSNDGTIRGTGTRRHTNASSVSPTRRRMTDASQDATTVHIEHPARTGTMDFTGTSRPGVGKSRLRVAKTLEWVGETFGTPAPDRFDETILQRGPASQFPTTPGEEFRNPELARYQEGYNPKRDSEGNETPLHRQRSRAGSFVSVEASGNGLGIEENRERKSTSDLTRMDTWAGPSSRYSVDRGISPAPRRATLEVPKQAYFGSPSPRLTTEFENIHSEQPQTDREGPPRSPTIVVSTASDQPGSPRTDKHRASH